MSGAIPRATSDERQQPLALYLHIPFCDTKCAYCDFNSYAGLEGLIPDYTRALCREIALWSPYARDRSVPTVFFGGGTPSLMPAEAMARVLTALRQNYRLAPDLELSLEANPGTVDMPSLRALRRLGFNRISLGVQSFDDAELKALDRIHSGAEAIAALSTARAAGFDNINLDLIFGLAGQTLAGWRANLEQALALRPEHLSLYALTVEEGTALAYQVAQGLAPEPDADVQAEMYELARELLANAGYTQYEISNWSLPGRACRHNLTYWRNGAWLGFGAGAHSAFGGYRFSNALSPRGYIHRVEQAAAVADPSSGAQLPESGPAASESVWPRAAHDARPASAAPLLRGMSQVVWQEAIDAAAAMTDTAILGLRLSEGLSLAGFRARHGHDLLALYGESLRDCFAAGLIEIDGDRLRLTPHGLLLANEVFTRLLPAPEDMSTADDERRLPGDP